MLTKAELKELLTAYNKPLVFKDLDLINLRYVDFSGLELVNVSFDDCFLACADFTGTYMSDVTFQNVNAPNCIFARTSIQSIIVNNTDLKNANFSDAEIINSNFIYTKLINSKFTNTNILNSSFRNVNFESCDFNYSYLDKISFVDTNLKFAIIPEIVKEQSVNFVNSDLQGTEFEYISKKQNISEETHNNQQQSKQSVKPSKIMISFIK